MNKTELTEYADHLLKTAIYMVNNIEDAEDLVQETLVAALVAIHQDKLIEDPKSWLVTVLRRRYYDMLRRKYHKGTVSIDMVGEIPVCDDISERIEHSEEAENIRRCLAHLTELYRQVMVRYYMRGESVKQIASALVNMMIIMNAHDNGLFMAERDFENAPVSAVFLAIDD